jgi:hypothetical protein
MDEHDFLAEQFEENRTHLRAVAYRIWRSACAVVAGTPSPSSI